MAVALDLDSQIVPVVRFDDRFEFWSRPHDPTLPMQGEFAGKGLEVIGVTLAYGHRFDPETDLVTLNADRSPADERADVAAYAKKHGIGYRLGVIPRATTDEYGVGSLPHTVLIDRRGNVKMVLQAGDSEQDAELQKAILELLLFNK